MTCSDCGIELRTNGEAWPQLGTYCGDDETHAGECCDCFDEGCGMEPEYRTHQRPDK